jgi:hypothetical protein
MPSYDHLKYEVKYQNKPEGPLDTKLNLVHKLTYEGEDFQKMKEDFDKFI